MANNANNEHQAPEEALSQDLTSFILQHYRKILVLERNPANAEAIRQLLQGEGYNITVVTDKVEALRIAETDTPEILLVTEGVTADSLLIRDEIMARNIKLDLRVLRDFGSSILGAHEGAKYRILKESYYQSLSLLMELLEFPDSYLYGHSAKVVEYCKNIVRKLDISDEAADEIIYAAYYHALPQLLERFIDNAEKVPIDGILKNTATLGLEKFLNILPENRNIRLMLNHLKERFDGKGYPNRLAGQDIPLGSRVITLVDIYMHMIQGGPGRKSVKRINAIEQLQKNSGSAFDPELVDSFVDILRKELVDDAATENREEILILDSTREDDLLKLKLRQEGYRVTTMDDADEARKKIKSDPPDLIISEVSLPKLDGFQLLKALKDARETRSIPFIFVSEHGDISYITKGLRLGAEDYIQKPYNMDILFLKIYRLLVRASQDRGALMSERRGVSGSLLEMGVLEVIQIMAAGSKTAMIHMKRGSEEGRIYMHEGQIANVSVGDNEGEDAFYSLLSWHDGDFVIHPDITPPEKNIFTTNDMLLLKGLQKLDETRRQFKA